MSGTSDYYSSTNTSHTFGNEGQQTDAQELIEAQKAEIARLMPAAVDIKATIDEEIAAVSDLRAYIKTLGDSPSANSIQKEYRARELYIGFLERLKQAIDNKIVTAEGSINE